MPILILMAISHHEAILKYNCSADIMYFSAAFRRTSSEAIHKNVWVSNKKALDIFVFAFKQADDYFEVSKNLEIFGGVYKEIHTGYVDDIKPGDLMKKGIDAMLGSLDPYTVYYTENDIEDYRYMTTGEYGGIGATVNDINGKIIIAEPYEGFSAYKAGLRAGDQIIGVNDINVLGKKSDEIGNLLKGQAGTPLKLKIIKAGETTPIDLNFKREEIKYLVRGDNG